MVNKIKTLKPFKYKEDLNKVIEFFNYVGEDKSVKAKRGYVNKVLKFNGEAYRLDKDAYELLEHKYSNNKINLLK